MHKDWMESVNPRKDLYALMDHCKVPSGSQSALASYILHGTPTGHFLGAILKNNLRDACNRADLENRYRLFDVVFFLFNYAPSVCWGSEAHVKSWHAGLWKTMPWAEEKGEVVER